MPRCLYRFDQCYSGECQLTNRGSVQIDDAILKFPAMMWKARNVKNRLTRINQLPPETLACVATFLPTERGLINATAVCQHWRATFLSFPRLWRNVGGSSSETQAYIERSGSTPIDVSLSSPESVELIAPHASRLVGLTIRYNNTLSFNNIVEQLCYPIPTLQVFRIIHPPRLYGSNFPHYLQNPFFLHSKKLEMEGISHFHGSQTLPHVTEFILCMSPYFPMGVGDFLRTLEQLPVLERLYVTFLPLPWHLTVVTCVVTLPHVQEMSLSMLGRTRTTGPFPHILGHLRLPKLTSLCVQAMPRLVASRPVSRFTTIGEHFPNLAELPELEVNTIKSPGEVTFRSPSQAVLKYLTGPLLDCGSQEIILWRELPLHTVRRLTVNLGPLPTSQELDWLVELLRNLRFLEHLEFEGRCDRVLWWLHHRMAWETTSLRIQTLTIRRGGNAKRQAVGLKRHFDRAGLKVALICIPDLGDREGSEVDTDTGGSSDEWDVSDSPIQW
jgi:hypothetical protein